MSSSRRGARLWSGALQPAQVSGWFFGLRAAGISQLLGFLGRCELWFTHFQGLEETAQIRTAVKLEYLHTEVREVLVQTHLCPRPMEMQFNLITWPVPVCGGPQGEGCFLTSSPVFLLLWFPQLEDAAAVLSRSLWSREAIPSQIQHYTPRVAASCSTSLAERWAWLVSGAGISPGSCPE